MVFFPEEFFNDFRAPKQCDTRSSSERCPDKAIYVVSRSDRNDAFVCERCVTSAIHYGTRRGKTVTISRVE